MMDSCAWASSCRTSWRTGSRPRRSSLPCGSTARTTLELLAPLTTRLPGAAEGDRHARCGGRSARAVVITAKPELTARLSLDSVGLGADEASSRGALHGPGEGGRCSRASALPRLRRRYPRRHAGGHVAAKGNARGVQALPRRLVTGSAGELLRARTAPSRTCCTRAGRHPRAATQVSPHGAYRTGLTARGLPHGAARRSPVRKDATRRGRPARLTGRAPVSISPADFSVTSAPKASASSDHQRRGKSSPGRYRSSTATRSARPSPSQVHHRPDGLDLNRPARRRARRCCEGSRCAPAHVDPRMDELPHSRVALSRTVF